jgi:hypothetical protein
LAVLGVDRLGHQVAVAAFADTGQQVLDPGALVVVVEPERDAGPQRELAPRARHRTRDGDLVVGQVDRDAGGATVVQLVHDVAQHLATQLCAVTAGTLSDEVDELLHR